MTRNLKALGLALVAAFAMSAIVASAAQAEFTFTGWEGEPSNHVHTIFKSEQETEFGDVFKVTSGLPALTCKTVTAEGTSATGDEATATVSPSYGGCVAGGTLKTVVEPTTCHYRFNIAAKHSEHEYTGTTDVVCTTPGDSIHIKVFKADGVTLKCEFTVEEQNGINNVTYHNITPETGPKDVTVEVNANNVKTVTTKGGLLECGAATGTTHTTGTYVGKDTVKAFNTAGTQINATVSG